MKREKQEAKEAKERVRAQIAKDKAERAARAAGGAAKEPAAEPAPAAAAPKPKPAASCRVQVRHAGGRVTHTFKPEDTVAALVRWAGYAAPAPALSADAPPCAV